MSSIIVRGLDEAVKQWPAARAKEHGRSMEAEVRAISHRRSAQAPYRSSSAGCGSGSGWHPEPADPEARWRRAVSGLREIVLGANVIAELF